MTKQDLIRLLLAVRQMNAGQFWALLRLLGASPALPPDAMSGEELDKLVKRINKK